MAITKIEVERVSVISSGPFEKVVEALRAAVGRPDSKIESLLRETAG